MRFPILLLSLLAALPAAARPWTDEVMYFAMTDRFCDGDLANNIPRGSDPALFDANQRDLTRYQGGDFRGVENALAAGYFNKLGVTALWLTPVVRNVWRSGFDLGGPKTGYHGYWAQDWLDIDPHLTSAKSLGGNSYPDNAEGRMEHYRDLVKLAHSRGIKIIQDVVMNHAGPVFYYDANNDGTFNTTDEREWIQPFKHNGYYANAHWAELPQWNIRRAQPDGPRNLLGVHIATRGVLSRLETYGRKGFSPDSLGKSDGEEIECDFFSLRDLWTKPGGAAFDALVDEFVEIYRFYLTTVGVDGLRIDTVKHVHPEFWDAFTERLRAKLGPTAAEKILFGEIYDPNPVRLGRATWRTDWHKNPQPALDSVLDFDLCFTLRDYLRRPGSEFGTAAALEKAVSARTARSSENRPIYNPTPGPDGLNASQKIISFIENHDGLNRFLVDGVTPERNRLAQSLLLTLPGIPCLYYGAEMDLHDSIGKLGQDSETGRMMFFRHDAGLTMATVTASLSFQEISQTAALRAAQPVLRTGNFLPLWVDNPASAEDDGVFAFARASADGSDFVIVVVNASDQPRVTANGQHAIQLPPSLKTAGKWLRPAPTTAGKQLPADTRFDAGGPLRLPVPASSLVVYTIVAPAPASTSSR